jgi:hypothetical protein
LSSQFERLGKEKEKERVEWRRDNGTVGDEMIYTPNPDLAGSGSFTFKSNGTELATGSITLNK